MTQCFALKIFPSHADVDWTRAKDGVLIAGAGIAGLATAAALQKVSRTQQPVPFHDTCFDSPSHPFPGLQVGISALVLERYAEQRTGGSAIGLWPNAFRALDALGAAQSLRDAHPLLQR